MAAFPKPIPLSTASSIRSSTQRNTSSKQSSPSTASSIHSSTRRITSNTSNTSPQEPTLHSLQYRSSTQRILEERKLEIPTTTNNTLELHTSMSLRLQRISRAPSSLPPPRRTRRTTPANKSYCHSLYRTEQHTAH